MGTGVFKQKAGAESKSKKCDSAHSNICQMVPNLASIAKNHCFPKHLPTPLAIFHCGNILLRNNMSSKKNSILLLFEILIVCIVKTIHFGLFIK